MKFEIYTEDMNYDEDLENKINNTIKAEPGFISENHGFGSDFMISEITSLEELIKYIKLHPEEQVAIYAPEDYMPSICYIDLRDPYEVRMYDKTEEEIIEDEKLFESLRNEKIDYIFREGDNMYCETESCIGFRIMPGSIERKW